LTQPVAAGRPLVAALSRGLTSRTQQRHKGVRWSSPDLLRRGAPGPRSSTTATPGAHTRNTWAVLLACQQKKRPCQSDIKLVELRGLEPLTFSLRRHRVHLIRREHRVIDVHRAAGGRLGCIPGAHMGHTMEAWLSPWWPTLNSAFSPELAPMALLQPNTSPDSVPASVRPLALPVRLAANLSRRAFVRARAHRSTLLECATSGNTRKPGLPTWLSC
jgi:hypothetical protein